VHIGYSIKALLDLKA